MYSIPVAENVFLMGVPQVFGHHATASYLIKGDKVALIEAAYNSSVPRLVKGIEEAGATVQDIDYIFTTHFHIDHTSAVGSLLEAAPKAKVIAHPARSRVLRDPYRVVRGAKQAFGELVEKFGPDIKPVPVDKVTNVSGGEVFDLGNGMRLRIVPTPGHDVDHVSIYEESTKSLFTGDAVCLYYSDELPVFLPPCSPPIFEVEVAKDSLRRLSRLRINHICTPHYGEVKMSPRKYFNKNIETITYWHDEIDRMLRNGSNFPAISKKIMEYTFESAGISSPNKLHRFFREFWLPVMANLVAMSYMAYLLHKF